MPNESIPPSNPAAALARTARLYRITAVVWAAVGLIDASTGHTSMVAVFLALSAMFIALGASKARQAANLKIRNDKTSSH